MVKWVGCCYQWMAHSYVAKCFRVFWSERVNENKSWNGGKEVEWHVNPLGLYIFLFFGCSLGLNDYGNEPFVMLRILNFVEEVVEEVIDIIWCLS